MFKDIKIRKIETSIPYDAPVSSISNLTDGSRATL